MPRSGSGYPFVDIWAFAGSLILFGLFNCVLPIVFVMPHACPSSGKLPFTFLDLNELERA